MKTLACALAALVFASGPVSAEQQNWKWLWVRPDEQEGWTTAKGETSVDLTRHRIDMTISARLSHEQPTLHLHGRVSGLNQVPQDGRVYSSRIIATGTLLNTDARPEAYVGTLQSLRTRRSDPSNGWGSDRITLQAGSTFVTLYRRVRSAN